MNRKKPMKSLIIIIIIGMLIYFIECVNGTLILGCIKKEIAEVIYFVAKREIKDMYVTVSYKESASKNKNVTDTLIENLNRNNLYYAYNVKNGNRQSTKKIKVTSEIDITEDVVEADNKENGEIILGEEYSGKEYTVSELGDFNFLMSNFYVVPQRAKVLESELDAKKLLEYDMKMKTDNNVPQILIYHTHSMEGFTDSVDGEFSTNIVEVGAYLTDILTNIYGYNVIHVTKSFDYVNGKLDRSKAYDYAREHLEKVLEDNPTIEVIIDVHRDGVSDDLHLVTDVSGKQTAQIMFFNGVSRTSAGGDIEYLYNKNKLYNLAFSMQLKLLAEKYFPGFTRKNYIDSYQYNLDLREKSLLVEVGAQTNSLQEAQNAMEPLAALLNRLLGGGNV